jgi:signal transduction histidine kinase
MEENKKHFREMAEALARFAGRLIEAQDQERMRLAHELHADIGSSLSILGIELIKTCEPASGSSGEKHPDIQEICQKLQEIGSRVSRLSNQLNPPMLKYFGLAKAIEMECLALSKESHMPVSFTCADFPVKPDTAVALHLFRVAQEALRNAAKHSRATGISVNMAATSNELILTISDNGIGFVAEQLPPAEGLGLMSMRERMRMIGGAFEIRSQPGQGTQIKCQAPLVPSGAGQAAHSQCGTQNPFIRKS